MIAPGGPATRSPVPAPKAAPTESARELAGAIAKSATDTDATSTGFRKSARAKIAILREEIFAIDRPFLCARPRTPHVESSDGQCGRTLPFLTVIDGLNTTVAAPLHRFRGRAINACAAIFGEDNSANGDVRRNPSGFVAREQTGGSASAGIILAIDESKRLLVGIAHDEAWLRFFDGPTGREATGLGHDADLMRRRLRRPGREGTGVSAGGWMKCFQSFLSATACLYALRR